ncbi:MAG: hypothetical protein H6747_10815 [Deltaproteobacteria bacterium]|nr:hypothetical protein [Deltaproteobacteria bacterium]
MRAEAATDALAQLVDAPSDPLELRHYLDRLSTYLSPDLQALAFRVLDHVAVAAQGVELQELLQLGDRDAITTIVRALRRDHYLVREGQRIHFELHFLRRWWCQERML